MSSLQQAQKLLAKMTEFQEILNNKEVTGESGAGLIKVTLNGKYEVKHVKIDPSLLVPSDVEILEDLILAAFKDALQKINDFIASESSKISAGLPKVPGMPF
ncbi:MAG: YbaB/EbfC family nucleoid-associated protein [Holosporales bacterium]|jgi:DNA-binding YbaB/EbfC family protein|nr:YbaB/EbfC family nucleoid-associated protein [Holosporales bacterium]